MTLVLNATEGAKPVQDSETSHRFSHRLPRVYLQFRQQLQLRFSQLYSQLPSQLHSQWLSHLTTISTIKVASTINLRTSEAVVISGGDAPGLEETEVSEVTTLGLTTIMVIRMQLICIATSLSHRLNEDWAPAISVENYT